MRPFLPLILALAAIANCTGQSGPTDESLGGAGGSVQTGGSPSGSGGLGDATGGADLGGANTGGDTSDGGTGLGGAESYPEDAFVTVWQTDPTMDGWWSPTSRNDEVQLPLAADGTYDMVVDWGDGTTTEITGPEDPDRVHNYGEAGTYVVTMRGHIEGWQGFPTTEFATCDSYGYDCAYSYTSDWAKLRELRQWGTFRFGLIPYAFEDYQDLEITATDVPDLSPPVTLRGAFKNCGGLASVDFSEWDVSAVTDLSEMFTSTAFNGDISGWDIAQVTDLSGMFAYSAFNGDLSEWDTSSVTDMSAQFQCAWYFSGDVSAWDTSSVTDMSRMFDKSAFDGDLSSWDTSSVTNMSFMFAGSAFDGDLSSWDTSSVTDMSGMFYGARAFNGDISTWDTSNVTDMNAMFDASTFNGDLSAWNTANVVDMSAMFAESAFNGDISAWDTSSVTDVSQMFRGAVAFNQDLGAWDINGLTDATHMLDGSGLSPANYDALLTGWASQETQTGVALGAEGIQYSAAAIDARAVLTEDRSWTITDGGSELGGGGAGGAPP